MFVYTMQPVVQLIVKSVEQPAASCKQTFIRLSNRLNNRFDDRLYRVNEVLASESERYLLSDKILKVNDCSASNNGIPVPL